MVANTVPLKSGCGPADWFQTHNVPYNKLSFRQWCWIVWHYGVSFMIMFAILTWCQEADILTAAPDIKGWKGFASALLALALYWILPHRMYYFFGDAPYSNYSPDLKDIAGIANGSTFTQEGRKFTTTIVSGPEGHYRIAVPYPDFKKDGIFPTWFEIPNVPYSYLYWRQWAWILWHYLAAFSVCFYLLSWFQESNILEDASTFEGWKGLLACGCGLILYWAMPHRMYYFHDNEPLAAHSQ